MVYWLSTGIVYPVETAIKRSHSGMIEGSMRLDPKTINKKVTSYIKLLDPGVFNLSEIKTVRLNSLITGYQNVNFFLELNGLPDKKFVIRFHPDNKNGADKTAVEAQNMVLLRDRGIPVPRVVYVGGPTFVNSSVIIMEFIDSKNIDFKDLSPPQIKSLGETVAKMHAIRSSTYSQTMGGPPDTTGDYEDYLQAMTEYSIVVAPTHTHNRFA
jgi:aminoglycoside phosphotransferase (APT) family kinase protein